MIILKCFSEWVLLYASSHRQDNTYHSLCYTRRGARCSSVVRAFAHGAMGRQIDPSWGGPIELGARCSSVVRAFAHVAMGRRIDPSWGGPIELGARCSSVVRAFAHGCDGSSDRSFMGGPTELFLIPASAPQLLRINSGNFGLTRDRLYIFGGPNKFMFSSSLFSDNISVPTAAQPKPYNCKIQYIFWGPNKFMFPFLSFFRRHFCPHSRRAEASSDRGRWRQRQH